MHHHHDLTHHHHFDHGTFYLNGPTHDAHDHGTLHHHHGAGDNNILIHDHDGLPDHDHIVTVKHAPVQQYGPDDHTHDKPAVEHYYVELHDKPAAAKFSNLRDNIVIHPKPTDESTSVDWADNIDSLTGNDPYGHLVYPDDLQARDNEG